MPKKKMFFHDIKRKKESLYELVKQKQTVYKKIYENPNSILY